MVYPLSRRVSSEGVYDSNSGSALRLSIDAKTLKLIDVLNVGEVPQAYQKIHNETEKL